MKNAINGASTENTGLWMKNTVLSLLTAALLLTSCGSKTKKDVEQLQNTNNQTEQVDSIQTVRLGELTEITEKITKTLKEQGIEIDKTKIIDSLQTKAIKDLYANDTKFAAEVDTLNKLMAKCCDMKGNQIGDQDGNQGGNQAPKKHAPKKHTPKAGKGDKTGKGGFSETDQNNIRRVGKPTSADSSKIDNMASDGSAGIVEND